MRLESAVSAYGEQFNLGRALFYNSFTTNPVVSCQNGIMPTTKSPRNRLLILLVAAVTAIATVVALSVGGADTPSRTSAPKMWTETSAGQLIFFAVLEGLYRDGVTNSDVDLIIPPDEGGKPRFDKEIFVYACPLCHPAFEALRLYRQREYFYGFKARINTLGPGLDEAVRTRLRSQNTDERRQAIEGLISRWVSQRLEIMRLTKAEREDITREIEKGRKQGMGGLENAVRSGQVSQSRTNCAICDGSFGACNLPTR
jgi:hypothetical protein